ncbi:hypothetical protein IWW48_005124 [Coemansia sp. RSA 1200]|nr:hypothetical protein IWW48_005124 [Coemansia sp. RSA 1200]
MLGLLKKVPRRIGPQVRAPCLLAAGIVWARKDAAASVSLVHTRASERRQSPPQARQWMSRNEAKIEEQREKRAKWDKMRTGEHRMRIDGVRRSNSGRSGGGRAQLLDARMRRARDQKDKHHRAREFVQRSAVSQQQRRDGEARILRQRSRQLKSKKTPGLGFTPARFKLVPIESETGSDLKTLGVKQLAEKVKAATFDNIGLAPSVADAAKHILEAQMKARNAHAQPVEEWKPTEIQALAIPEILGKTRKGVSGSSSSSSVFLAAETGSGKTFAYALPLVSMLKHEEEQQQQIHGPKRNTDTLRREARPRALVLVPSRELVSQVTRTFKEIAHHAKVRVIGLHLGMQRRALRGNVDQGPIDILVSTPGAALRYMVNDPVLSPARVQRLVVDEADSLMDAHSFGKQTTDVLDLVRRARDTQRGVAREQAIFVSATLPKLVREQIIHRYPGVVHVTTPSLHRAPRKLTQSFVDVSKDFQGHRLNALWYALRTAAADQHVVVFCNDKENANMVFRQLRRRGHTGLLLTGAAHASREKKTDSTDSEAKGVARPTGGSSVADLRAPVPVFDRAEVLSAFSGRDAVPEHLLAPVDIDAEFAQCTEDNSSSSDNGAAHSSTERKILVCTDLGSRGLDTTFVTHVVMFDFPTTAIDYLHRAGRTARAGGRGKVTALVGKKDRRLADQIRLAIRQGGVIS